MTINCDYVEEFKKTIKKGDFKNYIDNEQCKLSTDTESDVYQAAIYQGYLDACRTFKSENTLKKDKGTALFN